MTILRMTTSLLLLALAGQAKAATVYTGDIVQGLKVISALDVADLPAGNHRFMFQGVEMGSGQYWYVPVMVAKGAKPGKRVMLIAGVHGDELSPIRVVQKVMADLDPAKMTGTVTAVIGPNRQGLEQKSRFWSMPESGGSKIDPNRTWPGIEFGRAPERQSWLVYNKLLKGNMDVAIDHHTAGTGGDFTFFIFADFRVPGVETIARLFPVDQILIDPGLAGTLETALVKSGVTAITTEVGGPRSYDPVVIAGAVEGTNNVIAHYGITGTIGRTAKDTDVFVAKKMVPVTSTSAGFAEIFVTLNEKVKKGQKIALQRNAFGDVLKTYYAPVDGEVAIIAVDVLRETGASLVDIISDDPDAKSIYPAER